VLSAVEQNATPDARHFASFAAAVASAPEQVLAMTVHVLSASQHDVSGLRKC
jgi:hypothetical protein